MSILSSIFKPFSYISSFFAAISAFFKSKPSVAAESITGNMESEMKPYNKEASSKASVLSEKTQQLFKNTKLFRRKADAFKASMQRTGQSPLEPQSPPATHPAVTTQPLVESQQEKLEVYFDVNDYKIYIMEPGGRRELPMIYYYNTFKDTPEAVPYLALALGKEKGIINTDATPDEPYVDYENLVALLNDNSGSCTLFRIIDTNKTEETRSKAVAVIQKIPDAVRSCITAKAKGQTYIPLNEAAKAQIQRSGAANTL